MTTETEGAPEGVTEDTDVADLVTEETTQEQPGDDAAAAEAEGEGEPPKPRKTAQERIDEVTKARREAERRAEDAERDREYWRQQALRTQTPAQPTQAAEDSEPDPNDYDHGELDARFIRDHATFHAKKAFREESAKAAAQRERTEHLSSFDAAAKVVAEKHPDFFDVVGRDYGKAAALCTEVMSETILVSQDGPAIAYHLASEPAEARRIAALPPLAQAMELGKLSAKLATPPAPTAKTVTDAPLPGGQVRGAGGRFTVAPDTDDFAAFEKQYP